MQIFFLPNIFNPLLIDSKGAEPTDREGWPHYLLEASKGRYSKKEIATVLDAAVQEK